MLYTKPRKFFSRLTLTTAIAATLPLQLRAQDDQIEEVVVWGRSTALLGRADSASQGVVGYKDFSTRPIARVGELVEVIPGMIATQHSGPGKANQYFLRGFNLDHGSDFSTMIDGMPVNMRTHAHAQGYMDLNFIIPEIIERVEFQKGPYFADTGDFSLAGSNSMKVYSELEQGFTEVTLGSRDEVRLVTANSFDVNEGVLLYALEHHQTNGFFDLEQDVRKFNGLVKYSGDFMGIPSSITAMGYDSQWTSTNQVPQRAVDSGRIDRFGFIDPDLGGESSRYSITGNFELANQWELNLYASSYYMSLINNPTYVLNDPINGDEFEQEDERWLAGGALVNERQFDLFGLPATQVIGSEFRYDDVNELNLFNTIGTRRIGTIREDETEELSVSAFGEWEIRLSDRLRSTVGLRVDHFDFDVSSQIALNSGSDSDTLVQPKLGVAYRLNDKFELYGNYGKGFHSNDVRAAVTQVDPVSGAPADAQDVLVEGIGGEIGLRYDNGRGFNLAIAAFELETDSELVFVGDAGTTEPSDPTRRRGWELNSFWQVNDVLVLDLSAAKASGYFRGLPAAADSIPDAHEEVAALGLTYVGGNGFTSSLRVRHFGDATLTEDEAQFKDDSTLLHWGASYQWDSWELGVDVLNALDADDDDIAYFFESQLPGEAAPVEDIHFHPSNPRTIRLLLKYQF